MSTEKKGRGTSLTRQRIVTAALEIVDREGLAALSMRRLGSELGVDPMAAYYHIPNKDALLDAIVEAVMAEIDLSKDELSAPPEDRGPSPTHARRTWANPRLQLRSASLRS